MKKSHISLPTTDKTYLKNLLGKGSLPVKVFRRVTTLLELDRGKTEGALAQTLGVCYPSVSHWCQTYRAKGLKMLWDASRSGRPLEIDSQQRAKITALACSKAPAGHSLWSLPLCRQMCRVGFRGASFTQPGRPKS